MYSFVVVVGWPRSGSSLACDLVRACGYEFGPDVLVQPDKRMARNTHRFYSLFDWSDKDSPTYPQDMEIVPRFDQITALNIVPYFPTMLPVLKDMYPDLRVVVTTRDIKKSILSHVEYVLLTDSSAYQDKPTWAERIKAAVEAVEGRTEAVFDVLRDEGYDTFELPFERVVRR